ncbi:MAG: hypothetical protein Q9211_000658 [Gyalolechia sp. 1 TL-2023]
MDYNRHIREQCTRLRESIDEQFRLFKATPLRFPSPSVTVARTVTVLGVQEGVIVVVWVIVQPNDEDEIVEEDDVVELLLVDEDKVLEEEELLVLLELELELVELKNFKALYVDVELDEDDDEEVDEALSLLAADAAVSVKMDHVYEIGTSERRKHDYLEIVGELVVRSKNVSFGSLFEGATQRWFVLPAGFFGEGGELYLDNKLIKGNDGDIVGILFQNLVG